MPGEIYSGDTTPPIPADPEKSAGDYTSYHAEGQSCGRPRINTLHRILSYGRVEERGAVPVPFEERVSTRYFNVFTIWFSMNVNILA